MLESSGLIGAIVILFLPFFVVLYTFLSAG